MATMAGRDRVITAVRIRPLNERELQNGCEVVVSMDQENTGDPGALTVLDPTYFSKKAADKKQYERRFTYDYSFWSVSPQENFATQLDIFQQVGAPLIGHCMNGINCSILAYGQTGSGKTYTMIGYDAMGGNETGVVPRLCIGLLRTAEAALVQSTTTTTPPLMDETLSTEENTSRYRALSIDLSLSYYEIYNERVYDLLSTQPEVACRVRESREDGAYVEHLTKREFVTYENVTEILEEGNRKRSVASTLMNSSSSRSHAVFNVYVSQQLIPFTSSNNNNNGNSPSASKVSSTIISRNSKVFLSLSLLYYYYYLLILLYDAGFYLCYTTTTTTTTTTTYSYV